MRDKLAQSDGPIMREGKRQQLKMSVLAGVFNWAATPLGPMADWPDRLKEAVQILLTTGVPMWMEMRPGEGRDVRNGVAATIAGGGCVMDGFTIDRLIHPFETTKGAAGTGLGLWVSRGILDKHRSKIAVRSKPGCSKPGYGAVFRFLPGAGYDSGRRHLAAHCRNSLSRN